MDEKDGAQIRDYPCSVKGQDDIYGVGIRVGLYVQWYCTTLAYLYDPKEAANFTVMNYCFSIAVAVASIVHRGDVYEHEVIIIAVLMMLPPTVVVVTMVDNLVCLFQNPVDEPGRSEQKPKPYTLMKWLRDLAGLLSTSFLLCVAVWELFDGVKAAKVAPGCLAVFIKSFYMSASSKYERLLKAVSIMFAVTAPMFLILLMLKKSLSSMENSLQEEGVDPHARAPRLYRVHSFDSATMPLRSTRPIIGRFKIRSLVAFLWGMIASFVVAKIETVIKQNKIQNMMDPLKVGQMIPLIIGILQFCIVTYHFMHETKKANMAQAQQGPIAEGAPEKEQQ